MPHYKRNIRFILFLVLPILGFLLGWSLSQKTADPHETPSVSVIVDQPVVNIPDVTETDVPTLKIIRRNDKAKDVDLSIFWETWNTLESNFLRQEDFDVQKQIYGSAQGLVHSLGDPYTVFMTPEDTKKFEESISGGFEGIGAEIAIRNGQIMIVTPLKGSPAELAGIRAGDVIFKIDGESTHGFSSEQAITRIRGPKGEKVVLTILREDEREPLDITIVRDNIVLKNIEWEMKDNVAVISISQFGTELIKEFQEVLPQIILQNPRGIIIDLRNNGGGLLDACVKLASEFLDQQIVVKTKGRKFGNSGDIMTGKNGAFVETPLVVLVNKGSASASEIFAGAVQDHDRGLILGEKTFGKGTVQNVIPLSDGSSLKVTIAEWLTPDGKSIQEEGIEPDETIEMTFEDRDEGRDPVLDRALDLVGTDEMTVILEHKGEIQAEEEVSDIVSEEENVPEKIPESQE